MNFTWKRHYFWKYNCINTKITKLNRAFVKAATLVVIKHAKMVLCMHDRGEVTSPLWLYVERFSSFKLTDILIFGSNLQWIRAPARSYYSFIPLQIIYKTATRQAVHDAKWLWGTHCPDEWAAGVRILDLEHTAI